MPKQVTLCKKTDCFAHTDGGARCQCLAEIPAGTCRFYKTYPQYMDDRAKADPMAQAKMDAESDRDMPETAYKRDNAFWREYRDWVAKGRPDRQRT